MKYVKKIGIPTLTFILGAIIFGSIGIVVAENIASSTVDYNKNSQATVEDALDDLYEKASAAGIIPYTGDNLALHIKDLHSYDGDGSNLYYHDKIGNNSSYGYAEYEAGDLSYRYAGSTANVSNYLCFASDDKTCPSENLYRIIGLFKDSNDEYQIKLIKASAGQATVNGATMLGTNGAYYSTTTYYWNRLAKNNTWSESNLNKINLNTNYVNYLNNIDSKWINMIAVHTWIVGGNGWHTIATTSGAQNVYKSEITKPAENSTYEDEIGLMYVSDYMYGANPTYWNLNANSYNSAKTSNWLALGKDEWLITRRSDDTYRAFNVSSGGNFYSSSGCNDVYNNYYVIRPSFYLKSDVIYYDGTGTSSDPYRIALSE